jgi:competence protein ComEA
MITRAALIAAAVGIAIFALWHPVPRTALAPMPAATATSDAGDYSGARHRRSVRTSPPSSEVVVYVVGAVRRPGLYHLRPDDRYAQAVALAGGLRASADAAGVNLAQRAADGEEIDVPAAGEAPRGRLHQPRSRRRHTATPPPDGSVDINAAGAAELAVVPGIGRAIAARIVALRDREGNFASLDELLDVAGMTQSRIERARPYLREL